MPNGAKQEIGETKMKQKNMDSDFDKNENKKEDGEDDLISKKLLEEDFELTESLDNLPI